MISYCIIWPFQAMISYCIIWQLLAMISYCIIWQFQAMISYCIMAVSGNDILLYHGSFRQCCHLFSQNRQTSHAGTVQPSPPHCGRGAHLEVSAPVAEREDRGGTQARNSCWADCGWFAGDWPSDCPLLKDFSHPADPSALLLNHLPLKTAHVRKDCASHGTDCFRTVCRSQWCHIQPQSAITFGRLWMFVFLYGLKICQLLSRDLLQNSLLRQIWKTCKNVLP